MKIEELFEGGSFRMQRRKRNVFRMICLTAIVLVFTLVLLALVSIVSLVAGIIADANAPEIPNADIGPTDTIDIVDTKLHNGSLLILDEDNPYSGNKPKLFNLQARTDRPKIANGKDNAYTVLKAKQNSFMATDAAASALNKMIDGFYKAKKYTIDEIKERNYNLDLCGFPYEEEEVLPPLELLNQYTEKRAALDKNIDNVLSQIKSLLEVK